jgi:hypothetical protein
MLNSTTSISQFSDLVSRFYLDGKKSFKSVMKDSGIVKNWSTSQANSSATTNMILSEGADSSMYAVFRPEGFRATDTIQQYGYEKNVEIDYYARQYQITQKMRTTGNQEAINRILKELTYTVPNKRELDLTHRLTFAFVTSYTDNGGKVVDTTTGDGLALASAVHTLTGSANTYSTIVTGNPQFSKGALSASLKQGYETTFNNLGEKIPVMFDVIFCGDDQDTNNAIDELLNAQANVESNNSGTFNAFGKSSDFKMRKVRIPLLSTTAVGEVDTTKTKYWGVVSTDISSFYLYNHDDGTLYTPKAGGNGEDISTGNWTYNSVGAWGIGVCAARWLRISNGTGA